MAPLCSALLRAPVMLNAPAARAHNSVPRASVPPALSSSRRSSRCVPRLAVLRTTATSSASNEASSSSRTSTAPNAPSTTYTWQNRSAPSSPEEVSKQAQEVVELINEITGIVLRSGPAGVARGFKAFEAVATTGQEWLQGDRPSPPALLRKLCERLGATYVKLGQFIASSPTLFPEEYVLEFQKCLDKTEPIPFSEIQKTIQQELSRPLDSIFVSIDPKPLASASIAQVHSAVLKGSNKEVVLKVLKPGVSDILTADLSFLYVASRVLEFLNPELKRTSLSAIVGDIRSSMMEEVDFLKEQRNIAQFQDYLERMNLESVATCPFVYKELSSRRVLTLEKFDGVPLTDLEAIKQVAPDGNAEATLISALNTWFGSVMMCDSFHADVHAGNLLVLKDGRVAFIDFGIVGRISPRTWNAMQALSTAAVTSDFETMAVALAQMGAASETVDTKAFARDLELLFDDLNQLDADMVVEGTATPDGQTTVAAGIMVDDAQINDLLLNVVRVGETHGVKFPREFGLLLKQLLYFDRYVRLLAPGLQVFNDERVNMAGPGPGFDASAPRGPTVVVEL